MSNYQSQTFENLANQEYYTLECRQYVENSTSWMSYFDPIAIKQTFRQNALRDTFQTQHTNGYKKAVELFNEIQTPKSILFCSPAPGGAVLAAKFCFPHAQRCGYLYMGPGCLRPAPYLMREMRVINESSFVSEHFTRTTPGPMLFFCDAASEADREIRGTRDWFMKTCQPGDDVILKTDSLNLTHPLWAHFRKIKLCKPMSSRAANSEFYIILECFSSSPLLFSASRCLTGLTDSESFQAAAFFRTHQSRRRDLIQWAGLKLLGSDPRNDFYTSRHTLPLLEGMALSIPKNLAQKILPLGEVMVIGKELCTLTDERDIHLWTPDFGLVCRGLLDSGFKVSVNSNSSSTLGNAARVLKMSLLITDLDLTALLSTPLLWIDLIPTSNNSTTLDLPMTQSPTYLLMQRSANAMVTVIRVSLDNEIPVHPWTYAKYTFSNSLVYIFSPPNRGFFNLRGDLVRENEVVNTGGSYPVSPVKPLFYFSGVSSAEWGMIYSTIKSSSAEGQSWILWSYYNVPSYFSSQVSVTLASPLGTVQLTGTVFDIVGHASRFPIPLSVFIVLPHSSDCLRMARSTFPTVSVYSYTHCPEVSVELETCHVTSQVRGRRYLNVPFAGYPCPKRGIKLGSEEVPATHGLQAIIRVM